MLVFIDESGIHKNVDHSTFVVVYIETENYEKIESEIENVESELEIDYFHWKKTVWKVKKIFIERMLKLDFGVKIAVIRNPINPAEELKRVLSHKWYERKIKKILRDKGISVRKIKTVRSSQYAGIRLADMVAGLSRSYFDKKNLGRISEYYRKLQKKVFVIIE